MTPTIRDYKGRLAGTAGLSALGFLIHNIVEYGITGLADPTTATFSTLAVMLVVFLIWWFIRAAKRGGLVALVILAVFHLVGGAIISALPLPAGLLPFTPEQSFQHAIAHIIYGVFQLPLIIMGFWILRIEYR